MVETASWLKAYVATCWPRLTVQVSLENVTLYKFMPPTQDAEKWVSASNNSFFHLNRYISCLPLPSQQLPGVSWRSPSAGCLSQWLPSLRDTYFLQRLISSFRDSFTHFKWHRGETQTCLVLQGPDSKYTQVVHPTKHADGTFTQSVLPSPLVSTKYFWLF